MRVSRYVPKATNTLRMHNTSCFTSGKMVARTRLGVTWYVYCLSCLYQYSQKTMYISFVQMKKNQCYLPPKLPLLRTFFLEAKFTFWRSLV